MIPTLNVDPPITLEEALNLIQGDPDTYNNKVLYLTSNLLSMVGFMLYMSIPFMFQEPTIECFNSDLNKYFRCTTAQACGIDSYVIEGNTRSSFIS